MTILKPARNRADGNRSKRSPISFLNPETLHLILKLVAKTSSSNLRTAGLVSKAFYNVSRPFRGHVEVFDYMDATYWSQRYRNHGWKLIQLLLDDPTQMSRVRNIKGILVGLQALSAFRTPGI
ncbi:hypothetical protein G7Y89_g11860 [Cudoniella acicularis]|uniref:F-box domain-containing protein n=1 Tax=Cudoniella acicularis TaxID=354080 RepID=A0A8H4RA39_9HELO|nr:hypothetical protein G7Y89_g11860 [Cudoniella acicularis]